MKEKEEQEIIDLAYATYEPYLQISDELDIFMKSDDGGRHLQFSVSNRGTAKYLRGEVPHTFSNMRTIIRYRIEAEKE
jgi:hypothetical protein